MVEITHSIIMSMGCELLCGGKHFGDYTIKNLLMQFVGKMSHIEGQYVETPEIYLLLS